VNDYLKAILIGIIEGLTEFLPVSSTAHIRVAQEFLGVDLSSEYWKMFAIVIQLGAILAVIAYFRRRIADFVRTYPKGPGGTRTWWNHPLALVLISSAVTAIPCYLIQKTIGERLEDLTTMAWALVVGGVVMWLVDLYFSRRIRTPEMDQMTLPQAIVIGVAQIFAAAFPGTSRSMATIAGGQIMGLSRPAALEFSFFLSIPVMFAATGFKFLQYLADAPSAMTLHQGGVLAVGFAVSFIVALACIHWFMGWVRRHGFVPFAIYRLLAGAALLAWVAWRG
jgi:undecaprenyl-diphosphatase